MMIEDQLRERLRKIEALYLGAATEGEQEAADAAFARLKAKLDEARRWPDEPKLSFPTIWSARLSIALCRRYGLKPYRYPRQRNTTVKSKRRDVSSTPSCGASSMTCTLWACHEYASGGRHQTDQTTDQRGCPALGL